MDTLHSYVCPHTPRTYVHTYLLILLLHMTVVSDTDTVLYVYLAGMCDEGYCIVGVSIMRQQEESNLDVRVRIHTYMREHNYIDICTYIRTYVRICVDTYLCMYVIYVICACV